MENQNGIECNGEHDGNNTEENSKNRKKDICYLLKDNIAQKGRETFSKDNEIVGIGQKRNAKTSDSKEKAINENTNRYIDVKFLQSRFQAINENIKK